MTETYELKDVHKAVAELREVVESKDAKTSEAIQKIKSLEEFLDKQEDINQGIAKAAEADKKSAEEANERMDVLEKELSRKSSQPNSENYKESSEYKALMSFAKSGENGISLEEKALLRTDRDTAAGFLVPTELDTEIVKEIIEISPVRSFARVRTVSGKTLDIARRTTVPVATFEGEAELGPDGNSEYESEQITPFRLTITVPITMDMLMDAAFDMESEISADVSLGMGQAEGRNFVLGDGVKKPEGYVADTRVQSGARQTQVSAQLDADSILRTTGDLKTGYNPLWTFNRRTLAEIRTLKGTDDHFLWQPGLNGVVASTLAGDPYVIVEDMPDVAAGAFALAYGDFLRGYQIFDRTGLSVIRDDVTQKRKAIVEFTFHRWVTGQVVLPEAIQLLQIKP